MSGKEGIALERAGAFEFLAGIFLKEPSVSIVNELKVWAKEGEDAKMLSLLENVVQEDPDLTGLTQEYYDLFFVPVSGRFVPPFESAIRGAVRQAGGPTKFGSYWGDTTVKLADLYERTRFHPERLAVFEPLRQLNLPDHVGLELSFMAYLCRLEAKQLERGLSAKLIRKIQTNFLQEHLRGWLGLWVNDLERVQQSGYYLYFARQARDLCQEEAQTLLKHA